MRRTISILILGVCVAAAGALVGCDAAPEAVTDPTQLNGTWNLDSYRTAEGDMVDADSTYDSHMTMADGTVNGVGAVNTFSGSYEAAEDGGISFGPLAATRMAGVPQAMEQEDAFFDALETAGSFKIDGSELVLSDDESSVVAVFVPGGAPE